MRAVLGLAVLGLAFLGLAFLSAIVGPAVAQESNEKATIVDQGARVCVHPAEPVSGSEKRCFYANCFVGITVKSDEPCPDPAANPGNRPSPEK